MGARFNVPPGPGKNVLNIDRFRGVDLYNSPSNVDDSRSPEAPNMIRDVPGKVRKRMGFHKVSTYPGQINGVFQLQETGKEPKEIVHAGENLYLGSDSGSQIEIYTGMSDTRSVAWQFGGKLYILDGKKFLVYGEFDDPDYKPPETPPEEKEGTEEPPPKKYMVRPVEEVATVPKIIISRNPDGGGTTLDPINLLQKKWIESFLGKKDVKEYQLSFGDLDETPVTAKKLKEDGTWEDLQETTHFTVDRKTGKVTFLTAPGESPVLGHDNLTITASKVREGYADKINRCTVAAIFGVNGAADRLFVSGNQEVPNQDWYSQINDPAFFGDTWYSTLGQDNAAVLGYSIVNDTLAVHKESSGDGRNVILRSGILQEGKASFPIVNTLQGEGAIAKYSFAYLQSEPLFLTRLGVYAITPQDITGEKYSQNRSFYINNALQEEPNLTDAYAFIYRDFYLLALNKKVYILDGLQRGYAKGEPYSTYQYECYYWLGIDARILYERGGALRFGTPGGDIMEFYTDPTAQESYNDCGKAIEAVWSLPDIDGKLFFRNKTFRRIYVRLASAIATGVKIWVQKRGLWYPLFDSKGKARYFTWSHITWSKFSWSTDKTPKTIGGKIKVKKVDKARFRLENKELNEPFGLYNVALEYTETGYFK